jgi:hypothetical protein
MNSAFYCDIELPASKGKHQQRTGNEIARLFSVFGEKWSKLTSESC